MKDENDINPFGASEGLEWADDLVRSGFGRTAAPQNKIGKTPSPVFTSLGDLLNEPEEETSWIIDGLLPSSGFSTLVAKAKVGKSTFARQLALCVAHGEPFLDRATTKGPVLYVSLEEKRGEVQKHFRLMGADGTEEMGVHVGAAPQEAHAWLTAEVDRVHPVLVIIDTLIRFINVADINDYAKVTKALDPLLNLAREHKVHLMCVHHARKMAGEGADVTLGSSGIFGSVDTAIVLKKTDGKRTIETQQRYGLDLEATILIFNADVRSVSLGGTKEEEDVRQLGESIRQFLESKDEPMDEKTIDAEVEGRTGLKRKALREQVVAGAVTRTGSGKKGDPFQYSRSLVPNIYAEQAKQEPESIENVQSTMTIARSQDLPVSTSSEHIDALPENSSIAGTEGHLGIN